MLPESLSNLHNTGVDSVKPAANVHDVEALATAVPSEFSEYQKYMELPFDEKKAELQMIFICLGGILGTFLFVCAVVCIVFEIYYVYSHLPL